MANRDRRGALVRETGTDGDSDSDAPVVTAHATSPDRVVFTENGNHDGWIATDLAVDCWR